MSASGVPDVMRAGDPDALAAAELALLAGGIVGLPTETVYGLAVVPTPTALGALMRAKQRPPEKGIVLLLDSIDQVDRLVAVPAAARLLAARFWPGPLTLVLPLVRAASLPAAVTGGRSTLAVRVPDHMVPRTLARSLGPLAVSSANRSGGPESTTAAQLVEAVGDSVTLVLDGGPARGGVASSVVAVAADGSSVVLREGALAASDIERALARPR